MDVITPINSKQQKQVIAQTGQFIDKARQIYSRQFDMIPVLFDLTGRTAGMYRVKGRHREIRYNPYIFAKYFEDNLAVTVPHEVAHYIVDIVLGLRYVKPHGRQWRSLMDDFGADASRTCDYDLSGIPVRNYKRFSYRCDCRKHELTSYRHNKIVSGERRYLCRDCGSRLCRHSEN